VKNQFILVVLKFSRLRYAIHCLIMSNTIRSKHGGQELMTIPRRTFLQTTLAGAVGASLLPHVVLAEETAAATGADKLKAAISETFGADAAAEVSDKITIKAPEIAENGASVPVDVTANLDNIEEITLIAPSNPMPFIAKFSFPNGSAGLLSTRVKMGKTGSIAAVVKADGKLFYASKEVKVTIGGCGG
jgi:sulfur-oxidizing protein SoxY